MRKYLGALALLLVTSLAMALAGCSKGQEEEMTTKAAVNNQDPRAATAPAAETGESPAELAKRMQGQGGMAGKMRKMQ